MAVFIQQDISWLRGRERERERERVILMMENTRDTIISIGNNVRDLTNSWLKNNFRPAAEDSVWIQPIKRKKKKKKKNLLSWLSSAVWQKKKKKRDSKYYLHCSALFIEALKLFPDFQQKYICYYGNQSKQGNRRKNRGELKTWWLMWICGSDRVFVEVCWKGLILRHMSFFCLSEMFPAVIFSKIWRGNIFRNWSSLSFRF